MRSVGKGMRCGGRRRLVVLLVLVLCGLAILGLPGAASAATGNWQDPGNVSADFAGGSGRPDDPYLISTAGGLAHLAKQVNDGVDYTNTYFRLDTDVDLAAHYWTPIGASSSRPFNGTFLGGGHVIHNLQIDDRTDGASLGLFGYVGAPASIQRVGLAYADVAGGGGGFLGGLAGVNGGAVSDCYATGSMSGGEGSRVGGLVGKNDGSVSLSHAVCAVDGAPGLETALGGLIGYNAGTVARSYAMSSVGGSAATSGYYIGGLIGWNEGSASDCYATGNTIGGAGAYLGGFAGFNNEGTPGSLVRCFATGTVDGGGGSGNVGGFVGGNYGEMRYCFATGTVNGGASDVVGGLIGVNGGAVSDCYTTGLINAGQATYVGGLIGTWGFGAGGAVSSSNFWLKDTGYNEGVVWGIDGFFQSNEGTTALSRAAFGEGASFPGWDFSDGGVWCYSPLDGLSFPSLRTFFSDGTDPNPLTPDPDMVSLSPSSVIILAGETKTLTLVALGFTPAPGAVVAGLPADVRYAINGGTIALTSASNPTSSINLCEVRYGIGVYPQLPLPFILKVVGASSGGGGGGGGGNIVCPTSVSLNARSLDLAPGESKVLTATVQPANATNKAVRWTSSNPAVAKVDQSGKVTAVASGTATITATTVDCDKTDRCGVTVSGVRPAGPDLVLAAKGGVGTISADVTYMDAAGAPLAGRTIVFTIQRGDETPMTRTAVTDGDGRAFATFTGLAAGTYRVVASDGSNSSAPRYVAVSAAPARSGSHCSCDGGSGAFALLALVGGVALLKPMDRRRNPR